jgi:hypothetical protein
LALEFSISHVEAVTELAHLVAHRLQQGCAVAGVELGIPELNRRRVGHLAVEAGAIRR